MRKFFLFLVLFSIYLSYSVLGANCVGNSSDSVGCTFVSNVIQTEDITFSTTPAIVVSNSNIFWNCNGYELKGLGKNNGILIRQVGTNLKNVQFYNCKISDTGVVWYLQHPTTNGEMNNNFLNNSFINNTNIVMQFDGLSHTSYSFSIYNNGLSGNNIINTDYGIVTTGAYSQDGVGSGIFINNNMTNGIIGVRIGHINNSYSMPNEVTLGNWLISNNRFHNLNQAGVWVMQGNGGLRLATIQNNLFNNSHLLLQRSNINVSGNTFINSYGKNGCIEPIFWSSSYLQKLVWNSQDIPLCSGNYTLSSSIVVYSGKIYPEIPKQTILISSSNSPNAIESSSGTGNTYNRDNINIKDIIFVNFTNAIYMLSDCYDHYLNPITDIMSNWTIENNIFIDYDKEISQLKRGIFILSDDTRQCSIFNITIKRNNFFNLTEGIYLSVYSFSEYFYKYIVYKDIEISYNNFTDVSNGIKEVYVYGSPEGNNKKILFNNFLRTNNSVTHTGFQWYGNVNLGGSYIQDRNDCQKPDLVRDIDMDVTFCSGNYTISPLFPYSGVNIFCRDTIFMGNNSPNSVGIYLSALYDTGDIYKTAGASNIKIQNCTFSNFSYGIRFQGSTYTNPAGIGAVENNVINNNKFLNNLYGIYIYGEPRFTYTTTNNWNITNNLFYNSFEDGISVRGETDNSPSLAMVIKDFKIEGNVFNNNNRGIYIFANNYYSSCYDRLENFKILSNTFSTNNYHIYLNHTNAVLCPTQSPRNISAHYNIFSRDFTSFSVLNYAGSSQNFTFNNWGTGFTGLIDQSIFDKNDANQYGLINYIPIIGYSLQYGSPIAILENWEESLTTDTKSVTSFPITYQKSGYNNNIVFVGNEKWFLARTSSQAKGNIYIVNEPICYNTKCFKSMVDSYDDNPHYVRIAHFFPQKINFTPETQIRFKTYFDSDFWDSGGAIIFRNEDDQVLLKIDLGITNETNYATATGTTKLCSIATLTGKNLTGLVTQQDKWHSYNFTILDVKNKCSAWSNILTTGRMIDRVEFIFGGKRNAVVGDVIWYFDDLVIENVDFNLPSANTPPLGATIKFQETFGKNSFVINTSQCLVSSEGYDHTQFLSHSTKFSGDNQWICWINSTAGSPIVRYENSSDYLHISSDIGVRHIVSGSINPTISSFASSGNYNISMASNSDYFLFTCDMSNQTKSYSYLLLASNTLTYINEDKSAYISLRNGGCAFNNSLPYQRDQYDNISVPCCELKKIAGVDCADGKTRIEFSEQAIEDACFYEGVGDLSVSDIDRIEFVTLKIATGEDIIYFDDLYLYTFAIIGNNTLPNIFTMDCVPDPTNINSPVSCSVSISDNDNLPSEIYSAFDCDISTPELDYGWALRGNIITFNCTFTSEGTFTQKAFSSDINHYPFYNSSATATTTALSEIEEPKPKTGGTCVGYIPQTCSGNCYFIDNFNYDKMISCAGWNGQIAYFHPTNNILSVFGTDINEYDFYLDKGSTKIINGSLVNKFETKFDLRMKSSNLINFQIYNKELNKNVLVAVVDNYQFKVFTESESKNIFTLNPNEWYSIKIITDFNSYTNYIYINNNLINTISLYESGVNTARMWGFSWSQMITDFDIDNFNINILEYKSVESISNITTINYRYNPDMFCAINWSSNEVGKRFSKENCAERGFDTSSSLIGLCIPRACIQDISFLLFNWVTEDIFRTIIIVTAIILFVPLIIALLKK